MSLSFGLRELNLLLQRGPMVEETKDGFQPSVDKGLVAMFLRMSPEQRLRANDNALRTILELRYAYRQRRVNGRKFRRNS